MATDNHEMQVHQATYRKVINVLYYGAIAVGVIALVMLFVISAK